MRSIPSLRLTAHHACAFAAITLLAALSACSTGAQALDSGCSSQAKDTAAATRCAAKTDDLIEVSLKELRPTQPSLGYDELYYRLGRFKYGKESVNKRFDDWCESSGLVGAQAAPREAVLTNPQSFSCKLKRGAETAASIAPMKTVVIGPGGVAYLTDGHHTFTSFYETADGGPELRVRVRVQGNLSHLDTAAFWAEMDKRKWTWLRDVNDKAITPSQLPNSLGMAKFGNDLYRSVLYFGRDIGYRQSADNVVFQEFFWGRWLRANPAIQLSNYDRGDLKSYLALVKAVSELQSALPATAIVSDARTALELGRMEKFNDGKSDNAGEFGKLSAPFSDAKPGKLAYAVEFKKTLPR